jgi:hypothetical protein
MVIKVFIALLSLVYPLIVSAEYQSSITLERYVKTITVNADGTFTNRPLEDFEPFMDREEFRKEMIVNIV